MKLTFANRKNLILAVVVVGALLSREYAAAGLIVTLIPVGYYILTDLRKSIAYLINFRRISNPQRVKLLTCAIIIYVFVNAIVTKNVYYFALLVTLAVDYIIYDNRKTSRV